MTFNYFKNLVKTRKITSLIILLNILIYIYAIFYNIFNDVPHFYILALYGPYVKYFKQYYRLITNMFVHFDLFHITFNMLALWFLGGFLENYIKPIKFASIYFLSGALATLAIYLFNFKVPTGGASGAIYGLMIAILILTFIRESDFNEEAVRSIRITVLINLAITFMMSGISIAGHLGGSLGGLLILLYVKPENKNNTFKDYDDDYYWS